MCAEATRVLNSDNIENDAIIMKNLVKVRLSDIALIMFKYFATVGLFIPFEWLYH